MMIIVNWLMTTEVEITAALLDQYDLGRIIQHAVLSQLINIYLSLREHKKYTYLVTTWHVIYPAGILC